MLDDGIKDRLRRLDDFDTLADRRHLFQLPDGVVYLDGNSLGCLPLSALRRAQGTIEEEWGNGLIRSWLDADWLTLASRIGDRIGRLIGAAPGQTVAADSTSINLYKVLHAALDLVPDRGIILTDRDNFPTDLYILESVARQRGIAIKRIAPDALASAIDENIAVVSMTHVDYRSAAVHDMAAVTARAHAAGALTIWDLAHTAGIVPCELDRWKADFAVGCGYKYLNGGPGAPAFLYVADRHQARAQQPLQGWFGHQAPFDFAPDYAAAAGISRFTCGTPSIIGLSVLDGALDAYDGVDLSALYDKTKSMVREFLELFDRYLRPEGFSLVSGCNPGGQGSHIAFSHPQGYRIMRALADRGIIGDFRAPDVLRFGFAPLYNRYAEIGALVEATVEVMSQEAWNKQEYEVRQAVT